MSEPQIFQPQSLVAQVVAFLKSQIEQGEWRDWLPTERTLCQRLQVSRNTLRAALTQLTADRLIRPVPAEGNKILVKPGPRRRRTAAQHVALLSPDPIERLQPNQSLWVDEMRGLLSERGVRLRVFHGGQYFARNPGPALAKLIARNPHGCWILMMAGEKIQAWFRDQDVPCVIAGSTYPQVNLPWRDRDHRALGRHAAGVLLGLGHRRLALLTQTWMRAGDLECKAGFVEGVRSSPHPDADVTVMLHGATLAEVATAIRRLLKSKQPPTALLVLHPQYYLAVVSCLAQMNVRVPEEISVISRDDDFYLSFVFPVAARYAVSSDRLARSLLRPVMELLHGRAISQHAGRVLPKFFRGASISAVPGS